MTFLKLFGGSLRPPPSGIEARSFLEIRARSQRVPTESMTALLQHNETLMQEVYHRVGNSLHIVAGILALDARGAQSEEARVHLENAQLRILAVAAVQQHLQASRVGDDVELAAYLRQLCETLTASVVGHATSIAIDVEADTGIVSSGVATNLGLIVTELVINALKHAFTAETAAGRILVSYRIQGHGWDLTVSDNGTGACKPNCERSSTATGVGMGIIAALVRQIGGRIETSTGLNGLGTSVSIISDLPRMQRTPLASDTAEPVRLSSRFGSGLTASKRAASVAHPSAMWNAPQWLHFV